MDIGVSINPKSVAHLRECATAVEDAGLDLLAHPDSQAIDREVYASLAISAKYTETPRLGVIATNPVTRHISVTTSGIETINDFSNGRAMLCMARGDSAIRNTERQPASLQTLRESVGSIRELSTQGQTKWNGGVSKMNWHSDSDIPIHIAASGPRTLEMAGEVADGVVFLGNRDRVEWAHEQIKNGAEKGGQDPDQIEFWVATAGEVADSKEAAIDELRHTLAASLHFQGKHGTLEDFSDNVAKRIKQLADDYRPDLHNTFDNPYNAELVDKYNLRDVVENRPVAGTPSQVSEQLMTYSQKGADGVVLLLRHDHPAETVRRLGNEVLHTLP